MQKNIQVDEKENVISKEVGQTLHIIEEHNVLCVFRKVREGGRRGKQRVERASPKFRWVWCSLPSPFHLPLVSEPLQKHKGLKQKERRSYRKAVWVNKEMMDGKRKKRQWKTTYSERKGQIWTYWSDIQYNKSTIMKTEEMKLALMANLTAALEKMKVEK